MNTKTTGIVLSQHSYGESKRYLTLLTPKRGVLEARLQIHGQITRTDYRNINVPGYYHFNLFESRGMPVIDAAETVEPFFELRYDPERLALAQYFCELARLLVPSGVGCNRHQSLLLNALWLLQKQAYSARQVKAVYELRLLAISGYMPDLVCCKGCCEYEREKMYYLPLLHRLICGECLKKEPHPDAIELPLPVLHAMRFILYKNDKEVFGFKLGGYYADYLARICEYCILVQIEEKPVPLLIYEQFQKQTPHVSEPTQPEES